MNGRGVSVWLEAIDALGTHSGDAPGVGRAAAARDELLWLLGFTDVVFFPDLPYKIGLR